MEKFDARKLSTDAQSKISKRIILRSVKKRQQHALVFGFQLSPFQGEVLLLFYYFNFLIVFRRPSSFVYKVFCILLSPFQGEVSPFQGGQYIVSLY